MTTLAVRVTLILGRVHELERDVPHTSVNRVFGIARSHYTNINLVVLSEGYPDAYEDEELDELEDKVLLLWALSNRIESMVVLGRG